MTSLNLLSAPCYYLEIGQGSLQAFNGSAGLELPLERTPNGRLTAACKERVKQKLPGFCRKEAWQTRPRVVCAIGARGLLLRRFSLPAAGKEELARLLPLQIERELPLGPEELAWGYRPLGQPTPPHNGSAGQQEFLVAAVRKEVVEEYAELLAACELNPSFTVAALARNYLCTHAPRSYAVLDIAEEQSELVAFDGGVPVAVRIVPWGGKNITQSLAGKLGLGAEEAARLKGKLEQEQGAAGEDQSKVQAALEEAVGLLAGCLDGQVTGQKMYLSGRGARNKELVSLISQQLPQVGSCEVLEHGAGEGRSAAVLGLRAATENPAQSPPLLLHVKPTNGATTLARPAPWKLVGIAVALALGVVATPYLEAICFKGHLAKRLAALKADRGRLPMIDHELDFLQYLKQNQPPYLDTLYLFGKAAPPGAKLESVSMNRRGDLSLRGTMQDSSKVAEFRKKLMDSGLFASLTVEEQTPAPDHRKLNIRMSGQWKPLAQRALLALGPSAEELEKAKTRKRDQPGMPPMMPGGMMGMPGPGMPGPVMPGMPGMSGGGGPRPSVSRRSMSGGPGVRMPGSAHAPTPGGTAGFPGRHGMPEGVPAEATPPTPPPNQP